MVDQGADVVTCHVDSPKVVIETAEKRGIFSTGYHANQAALAPKGYLTGAEWNWAAVYKDYVEKIKSGQPWQHLVRGGFKEGFVKMSPYGAPVSADAKVKARLTDLGGTVLALSPADYGKLNAAEIEKWAKVIKFANIKPR